MPSVKISDEILDEFKEYTKISHDTGDEHLLRVLNIARARYDYEDLLEFFNDNYQDDLLHFGFLTLRERDVNEK